MGRVIPVLVLGAGGAAANGFIRALRMAGDYHTVGTNCNPDDALLSEADETHIVPPVTDWDAYKEAISRLLFERPVRFVHAQPDVEVEAVSKLRSLFSLHGTRYMLPSHAVVEVCQDKWLSHQAWKAAGLPQPQTALVRGRETLYDYICSRGNREVWLRATSGAGGFGALKTDSYNLAVEWVRRFDGWGKFTVAEVLTERTVTWTSVWRKGEPKLSQQRRRASWANARNSPSGVSGSTGVGETCFDAGVEHIALDACTAVDLSPHGIYSVDLCYDRDGRPNPTEINIGRFFTTVPEFFARAGFNIADRYVKLGLEERVQSSHNPLRGDRWVRGMDHEPVLA